MAGATGGDDFAQDWVLEGLVELANKVDGFSLGGILTIDGVVMSGYLIGLAAYFEDYGKMWGQMMGETEPGKTIREH